MSTLKLQQKISTFISDMHIRSPAKSLASCRMMCPAINSTYFTKSSFATNHNQRHADWHVLCPSFSSGTRLPLMSSPVNRNFPIHVYFIVFLERMVPVTADTNSLVDKCYNLGICLFLISICPADFFIFGRKGTGVEGECEHLLLSLVVSYSAKTCLPLSPTLPPIILRMPQ